MPPKTPEERARPWGRTAGVLVACLVTLIGVVRDLDPDVILGRAVLAGFPCGVLAAVVAAYAR